GTGYENHRVVNVDRARENVGTQVMQKSGIQCFNFKKHGHVSRECQKSKRAKDEAYHKENMLLCKQEEAGVQLNAEQADWKDDTDDESDDQELEAHYMYMAQIKEVTPDPVDNSGPIFDAEPLHKDDVDELAQEYDLLASLVDKLKCEIDDSKNRNKFLESSHKAVADKLKGEIEDFKTKNKSLKSSNNHFKEAKNELSKTNQLMFKDLKKFQSELDKYHDVNYASKELFAHQETISIMSQEKEAQITLYKTRVDKELDKVIALENKVKVLNDIVYKTGQSVHTMNMPNRNCKTSFAKPKFLKKAQRANPRLYDIGCYNDNLALMLAHESDKTIHLDKESRSKLSDLIRPFDYDQLNNIYDLFIAQREKSPEQHYFPKTLKMSHTSSNNEISKESFRKQTTLLKKHMDESIPWDQKCKSSKELFKIKKCVDIIFDGVERCKQTIAKRTYFGNIDPFIQNTIEGNFCPQIRRINADLEKFHLCLNEEMVADLRYFNSLEHEVDTLKSQLETQKIQFLNEIDRLSRKDKNDKSFKENQSNVFMKEREQYFEIQDLKAQLQDKGIAISELKKLIEKMKGKSEETKFAKSLVIRQLNAFKSQRQSVLGKPTTFLDSLEKKDFSKSKSVTKNNMSNEFSKPVTAQILPQNIKSILKNTNVIAPGMYKVHTEPNQTRTP
ncbi:hypothetical protein Tco_0637864, partial [Tanacetum coccineum]